jgi:RNA polymerase sigma factor (TIGR02999 family)
MRKVGFMVELLVAAPCRVIQQYAVASQILRVPEKNPAAENSSRYCVRWASPSRCRFMQPEMFRRTTPFALPGPRHAPRSGRRREAAHRARQSYAPRMATDFDNITGWLNDWQQGDPLARDRVFTRLYAEMKRMAAAVLRSESGHDTMQPTALLNDALMKLIQSRAPEVEDRGHFIRVVARAMRQILIDRARRKLAEKRGGGVVPESIDDVDVAGLGSPDELVALDDALSVLAELDPRAAAVVEMRVFAGLTIEETARALDIHPSAVNREWAHASAWLREQLGDGRGARS